VLASQEARVRRGRVDRVGQGLEVARLGLILSGRLADDGQDLRDQGVSGSAVRAGARRAGRSCDVLAQVAAK